MIPIDSLTIKNDVAYLTEEIGLFGDSYVAVREKEGRILTDEEVSQLPYVAKENRNAGEWQMRNKSAARFISYLRNKSKSTILEVGCGNGWFSHAMAFGSHSVVGLDINVPELEQAARVFKKENLQFVYGDLFAIGDVFKHRFDIIVLNASVQYFEDFDRLFGKLKAFLTPKGEIHIIDSPFYPATEVADAKKRTEEYYKGLGFPEMAQYYFHHSLEAIKDFTFLYRPKNSLWNRALGKKDSPFPWVCFRKS
ncbi:class I SAM-dependent methyltransferase [Aureisphaera galaxeae]|uniref:class I SAM-dependent methyltransferase n=1 Tax=Aureisphaera galaxeae TaxID=1538023 RepID=UPI0023506805|nr:class I SAM-dependent methyltransferase [Aureisphaera galaxeae]MDC8003231.1 class I SAM-dependent methyltransferase [Aureisphaera galaxeae]